MSLGTARGPAPLHADDPRRLGRYRLTGRLGSGGMGVVYLARDDDGRPVAVKLVHTGLAGDDEFRRRFRSEVNRARQVPPFCTAEVLGADLDHEPPYLVVEYVDGPSLAEVVEQRGPLSAANLHSLAIGVATALTAIHGAGVIHRDLKPRNVLLAPGSPKVIDFGIARALDATSQHTLQDQMVGTVAYMAPERFQSAPGTALTPAADIFAWGVVVAYAGTGLTPFHGDSPPATAGKILTQPPHLDGLAEPLRGLVELTLAKDPTDRPTARELLDLLLTGGPAPTSRRRRAPRHQQPPRRPAEEPTSVGGRPAEPPLRPRRGPFTVPRLRRSTVTGPHPREAPARLAARPAPARPSSAHPSSGEPPPTSAPVAATTTSSPMSHSAASSRPAGAWLGRARLGRLRRGRSLRLRRNRLAGPPSGRMPTGHAGPSSVLHRLPAWQWGTLVTAALLLAGVLSGSVLFGTGIQGTDLPAGAAPPAGRTGTVQESVARPAGSAAAASGSGPYAPLVAVGDAVPLPSAPVPTGGVAVIQDPLNAPGLWVDTANPQARASCLTRGTMRVSRLDRGVYRCAGPTRHLGGDHSIAVNTTLETAGSCAAIWFRYSAERGGQVLRVCQDRLVVAVDRPDDRRVLDELPLATPIALATSTRVQLVVRRNLARVYRDGALLGTVPLNPPPVASAPAATAPAGTGAAGTGAAGTGAAGTGPSAAAPAAPVGSSPARTAPAAPAAAPGQVALGISVDTLTDVPPYAVTFANVDIRTAS